MEIILSLLMQRCNPGFHGSIGRNLGYVVQRRKDADGEIRYFGIRKSNTYVPRRGHLQFIFACADIAESGLIFTDIRVSAEELREAFDEAQVLYGDRLVKADAKQIYNAREVLEFKKWFW